MQDGSESYPRLPIVSVAYAVRSGTADGIKCDSCVTTVELKDSCVVDSKVARDTITAVHIRNGTIKEQDIAQNAAQPGQMLKWIGGVWEADFDEIGAGTSG